MPVRGVLLCIVATCGAACATAFAQSIPEGRFQLPAVPSLPSSSEGSTPPRSLRVHQIVFKGNKALPVSVLQAAAAAYIDRELNPEQIEELRITLTRQYTDRGYANSGVLLDPVQPDSDGILHFTVIEGRVTQVRVHGLKRLRPAYVIGRFGRPRSDTEHQRAAGALPTSAG